MAADALGGFVQLSIFGHKPICVVADYVIIFLHSDLCPIRADSGVVVNWSNITQIIRPNLA